MNVPGSFSCVCEPGYTGDGIVCNGTLFQYCFNWKILTFFKSLYVSQLILYLYTHLSFVYWFLDIDECLNEDSLCEHGQCTNKAGSYECECEIGYIPAEDKRSCVGKAFNTS